jgi:hypothetical protein
MPSKPLDPNAHFVHAPGRRLVLSAPLRFVRERAGGAARRSVNAPISMVSFLDVLIVTVLFLLTSFSASAECPSRLLRIPGAVHGVDIVETPLVAVTRGTILVDGVSAGSSQGIADDGRLTRVDELARLLASKRTLWLSVQPNKPFPGECLLMIDQDVPAVVVKSVFHTAVQAGYPRVSFMVKKLPS